jgi:four helix bundle protein
LQHYRIAYGSCLEAKTTVEILVLSGRLDRETGRRWWADLHRVGGMLWGLMKSLQ